MKVSVAVIAHNEELWIKQCLESLRAQTYKPDEIILLAHNCSDETISIAEQFPEVKTVVCNEGTGSIISRMKAIEATSGDIICCTDGDCWVDKDWVKNIVRPLIEHPHISIVAGYTKIHSSWFWRFSCWWQFYVHRKFFNMKSHRFVWGSNFAFRKTQYEDVKGLAPFLLLHKTLNINYWAEDVYISLALQKYGKIYYALDAIVHTQLPPEKSSIAAQIEIVPKQQEDNKKLFTYFASLSK